ncbi:HlyD family secretion protein [Vibrio crassostreae]|uniref:HlyD family secretion protein n=1 Tax=Vibrio crassostreae TaxID=246167 RepID=UPI001B310CCB|nr:HlyD family efflux transporter periplasmic adaptor subunit [Vibrio crassostreae]CAK3511431.1 hypothetical protein VCRA2121O334_40291 [Vibrio crassostreae]CAK3518009.1 hypothetical protein VCRA2122O341_30027 [Vibrio crassostreae]CAK3914001.1 hypothetical protein VCRA2120O333_40068 [Vibrio crassostreae]
MFIGNIKPRKNTEKQLLVVILITVGLLFIFILFIGRYADKIDVKGEVKINNSLVIYAENSGIVENIYKSIGSRVSKGELLFKIKNNSSNYSNNSELSSVKQRLHGINGLIDAEGNSFSFFKLDKDKEINDIIEYLTIIKSESDKLKDSLNLTEKDIAIIKSKETRFKNLYEVGAISLDSYNEVVMALQQRLADKNRLHIEISNKSKEIINGEGDIDRIRSLINEAETNYLRQLESLNDRKLSLEKSEVYYVYAPASGYFSYSVVNENQVIADGEELGTISNGVENDVLVDLYTDSKAMSYLGIDNQVVVRIDAFPYEEFGVLKANILSVSPSKIKNSNGDYMFNVRAKILNTGEVSTIDRSWLKDGMTISATYSGPELSLIEWLFLPVIKGVQRNPDFWRQK